MPRPNTGVNFNIVQLERILHDRKSELSKLERHREELRRQRLRRGPRGRLRRQQLLRGPRGWLRGQ